MQKQTKLLTAITAVGDFFSISLHSVLRDGNDSKYNSCKGKLGNKNKTEICIICIEGA